VPPPNPTTSTLSTPTEEELQYEQLQYEKYEVTLSPPTEEELQLKEKYRNIYGLKRNNLSRR